MTPKPRSSSIHPNSHENLKSHELHDHDQLILRRHLVPVSVGWRLPVLFPLISSPFKVLSFVPDYYAQLCYHISFNATRKIEELIFVNLKALIFIIMTRLITHCELTTNFQQRTWQRCTKSCKHFKEPLELTFIDPFFLLSFIVSVAEK